MDQQHQKLYLWIGRQIADLRKNKLMTQAQLAQQVGLSQGSIANIERGQQQSPLHIILMIATVFDVPANTLIPLNDEHLHSGEDLMSKIEKDSTLKNENKLKVKSFIESLK